MEKSLEQFGKWEEEVNMTAGAVIELVQRQRDDMLSFLRILHAKAAQLVAFAIQETNTHSIESDYHPTTDCAGVIWTNASQYSAEPVEWMTLKTELLESCVNNCFSVRINVKVTELIDAKVVEKRPNCCDVAHFQAEFASSDTPKPSVFVPKSPSKFVYPEAEPTSPILPLSTKAVSKNICPFCTREVFEGDTRCRTCKMDIEKVIAVPSPLVRQEGRTRNLSMEMTERRQVPVMRCEVRMKKMQK